MSDRMIHTLWAAAVIVIAASGFIGAAKPAEARADTGIETLLSLEDARIYNNRETGCRQFELSTTETCAAAATGL